MKKKDLTLMLFCFILQIKNKTKNIAYWEKM